MANVLALIPARGGSKGLPGKNTKDLCGKPLIAHSIDTAKASTQINRIIVTTDDQKIADVAKQYGAELPFMRPAELATDKSLALDAFVHAINWLKDNEGYEADCVVILYPTCPIRNVEDIDNGVKLFLEKNADSVMCVSETLPASVLKVITDKGTLEPMHGLDTKIQNRQDFQKVYVHNGVFFMFSPKMIRERKYYGTNTWPYVIDNALTADIDFPQDFVKAELILKHLNNKSQ
ncbi:acylneuraminate cytidylyltransferase family protein [archaeon]|jgi:CMP-N,N'-diacetyllegionaminic acid synthase|nr:acylneuraminate cytidylyltransferase family protein [archaeon]MBT6761832.1 acylneuraminate cytidylyltransferase family protein [archaeon]